MNKIIDNIKKIFSNILIVIAGVLVVFLFIFAYYKLFAPDVIKSFEKYDGISFDYTLEEDNYKDKLYYKQLTESEARHYRCMYHAAINNESMYCLKSFDLFDSSDANKAVTAFSLDFPEYYWFGQVVTAESTYFLDKLNIVDWEYVAVYAECNDFEDEDIITNKTLIDNKLEKILPSLVGEDDYSTIKNVYNYIIDNVEYDLSTRETSDIRAALIDRKAVCSSYAETFQLICNRLGYECYSVQGDGKDLASEIMNGDEKHEWNIININDNWYWVDPTWGDNGDQYEEYYDLYDTPDLKYNYSYFLVPDRIFLLDHVCEEGFNFPKCTDETLYVYNNSGAIIDDYDDDLIRQYIIGAFKDNRHDFTFHPTNEDDMNLLIDWVERKKFYEAYRNNIYEYYDGVMTYAKSNNYSIDLMWNITNLY